MIHCTSESWALRPVRRVGSATLTMLTSSRVIAPATRQTARARQRAGSGVGVAVSSVTDSQSMETCKRRTASSLPRRRTTRTSSADSELRGSSAGGVGMEAVDLDRFVRAQDEHDAYATALAELRAGSKRSHWMWFVFPQIAGLGRSSTAQHYSIDGLPEAQAYLAHPLLGPRLVECARALAALDTQDAVRVFGPVDAQKLRSSMTLFAAADPDEPVFTQVLDQYFAGEPDEATTGRL